VIEGLYAAGNTSSTVMGHTYAGPGATIGPAIAFGYLAALHACGRVEGAVSAQERVSEESSGAN
jgi:3-oxosteroid 1-dehydrogenase